MALKKKSLIVMVPTTVEQIVAAEIVTECDLLLTVSSNGGGDGDISLENARANYQSGVSHRPIRIAMSESGEMMYDSLTVEQAKELGNALLEMVAYITDTETAYMSEGIFG
ncbi:hypothetical protein MKY96_32740 [Paenibacillus sp. FSL R7-0302]|uniref:hypothetical protein n=1 Tax=Paenibacillus sp. FSL R7-0302 TaxID=2921681 RepID=UPI0030F93407